MTLDFKDPVALTQALIRCPSVTPDEGGALTLLEAALKPAGFDCHRLMMTTPGTPDVDNLYARLGRKQPNLCFAGHTDVVPVGDAAKWTHPPFGAEIHDGVLYGRGAVDMKGAIAAVRRGVAPPRRASRRRDCPARSAFSSPATRKGPRSTAP